MTNCMKQSFWEANSGSARQIPCLSQSPKTHYRIHEATADLCREEDESSAQPPTPSL
jgi:hypothetical protein